MFRTINIVIGTVAGSFLGLHLLAGHATGLPALIGVVVPAFAGATTATVLGYFASITGGIIGGLVGVFFTLLPIHNLLIAAPGAALATKILVAGFLGYLIPMVYPH